MKKQTFIEKLQNQIMTANTYRRLNLGLQSSFTKNIILFYGVIQNYVVIGILQVYRLILAIKYYVVVCGEYCCKLFIKKSQK